MIVQCPSCGKKYKFPDEKIKPEGTKVKCPSCGHVFVVYPPKSKKKNYMIKTPEGLELGPYDLSALKDLIKRGEIVGNESVSVDEKEYIPIRSLPELKELIPGESFEKSPAAQEDIFGEAEGEGAETTGSEKVEITTGELGEDLFGEELDFDTGPVKEKKVEKEEVGGREEDLFGDISAEELESSAAKSEDLFSDEELGGEFAEGSGEEEPGGLEKDFFEGGEGEAGEEGEAEAPEEGRIGMEEKEEKKEEFFGEDIESDENLAEEVEEEEITPPPPSGVDEEMMEEEKSEFLEESFAEETETVRPSKKKEISYSRLFLLIGIVVIVAFIGGFITLLFVPELSDSPGLMGRAGLAVQKMFNTRYYQKKELKDIQSNICSIMKDHNSPELLHGIKVIENFLENSDIKNSNKMLISLLFELYLELYENTAEGSYLKKLDFLFRKWKGIFTPYLTAYYYYDKEDFKKAGEIVKNLNKKSQKARLLIGKILRSLGKYNKAGEILVPSDFNKNYRFLVWREKGILDELRNDSQSAYNDFISGMKENPTYFYNYFNLLLLVTSDTSFTLPSRVVSSLKLNLKKIALPAEEAKTYYYLALYYYQKKIPATAFHYVETALKLEKNNPDFLLLKGKIFYTQGKMVDAYLILQKARNLNPSSADIYLFLGMTTEGLKKPDKAEEFYKKAISLNPDFADAYLRLSSLYLSNRNFNKAHDLLDKAMETLSENVKILLQVGRLYIKENKLAMAEKFLRKAATIAPEDPDVLLSFSELLVYRHKYSEALPKINSVIKKHPYNDKAYYFRGLAYYYLNKYEKAAEDFRNAKVINQKVPQYYLMYGKTLYMQKKYDEAVKNFERSLDLNPNLDEAYFYLALSYMKLGSYFQAEDAIKKAIRVLSNDAEYHYYLGLIYEKEKRSGYAFDEFKKSVEIDEGYIPGLLKVGEYYFNLANFKQAIDTYTKLLAVARGRQKSHAYFLIGKTFLASSDAQRAYNYLRKAILKGYKTSDAYTSLGEAMESLGMENDAMAMYKRAIRLNFKDPLPHYRLGLIYKEEGDFGRAKRELSLALKYNPPQEIKDDIVNLLKVISLTSP